MGSTRLEQIVAAHRRAAREDQRDLSELVTQAQATSIPRSFAGALASNDISVIAEIKRRSPSMGDLNVHLDPVSVAADYVAGGASCLSVLTDHEFFGGSVADLQSARSAVAIPVLRKDFTVHERDVADARIMGADAILLIVAALTDAELRSFSALARELQLTALFEVHDEAEVQRALAADATFVGVNQRNLHTFGIDRELAPSLAPLLGDVVSVAESGIRDAEDVAVMRSAGFDAVLVGTSLVTSSGHAEAVRNLLKGSLLQKDNDV